MIEATRNQTFLWVDDTFVTGILAEKQQIPRNNYRHEHYPQMLSMADDINTKTIEGKSFVLLQRSSNTIPVWNAAWERLQK